MPPIIHIKGVEKEFKVPKKIEKPTFWTGLKSIFYREWDNVKVLHNINFDIEEGEFVGYIGPNGAGKSTTIKILTGVLTPTAGEVNVCGFVPHKQRYDYTYNIGVVFGHRSLLEFDIPVSDSFMLYKDIYEMTDEAFNERMAYFSKILKIDKLLHIPVRKLSLGQRMRCEIAASLLHKPKVVFLDEPTIGLDADAKQEVREFLMTLNKNEKTTIILTTHDMDDIEALCKRIIVIDEGEIIYDGPLGMLKRKFIKHKTIELELKQVTDKEMFEKLLLKTEVTSRMKDHIHLKVDITKHDVPALINDILKCCSVVDMLVQEPKLEQIIKEIYASGVKNGHAKPD